MKITPEHYETMHKAIQSYIDARPGFKQAAIDNALSDPRVKDYKKRARWDLCYAAIPSKWISDNIYPYANDDHLDTALKRITNLY